MAGPFYGPIKGTTAGTPGTGAFTPNAASAGYLAWSTVPTGWIGLVRYEDGAAWELQYSYWNGTTLSRAATTQFVSSSSGSALTLTSAATAALVVDGNEVSPHPVVPSRGWKATIGASTTTADGLPAATVTGTAASAAMLTTNALTEQPKIQLTSATTANAQAALSTTSTCGVLNTTSGRGGWEFAARFGCTQLPTGPRVFIGMTAATFVGNTGEPSAITNFFATLGKDSTDTNLQFMTNDGISGGTKIDTAIALVANGLYEVTIWCDPGSNTMRMLLFQLDTGAIFYKSTAADVPTTTTMVPNLVVGLSATTGTAVILMFCELKIRQGAG